MANWFTMAFGTSRHDKGQDNQAGDLAPLTTPWGQQFSNGRSTLITCPRPIGTGFHRRFSGTVGFIRTNVANSTPLVTQGGFFGDVPTDQQPWVDAPPAWDRP